MTPPTSDPKEARGRLLLRFFAALLNVEECAAGLKALSQPLPGRVAQDVRFVLHKAQGINEALLGRFGTADAEAVDAVNSRANLLNRLAELATLLPEDVAEAGADAFAAVAQRWADAQAIANT